MIFRRKVRGTDTKSFDKNQEVNLLQLTNTKLPASFVLIDDLLPEKLYINLLM